MGSHATTRRRALLLILLISIAVPLPGRAEHGPEVCSNTVCVAGSLDVSMRCDEASAAVTCDSLLTFAARGRKSFDPPLPWGVSVSLEYTVRVDGRLAIEGEGHSSRGCGLSWTRCAISYDEMAFGDLEVDIPEGRCATFEIDASATARAYPIGASSATWLVDPAEDRHTDAAEIEICR